MSHGCAAGQLPSWQLQDSVSGGGFKTDNEMTRTSGRTVHLTLAGSVPVNRNVRQEEMMKNSTAFRQSRQAVWVTGTIALALWGAYTWLRWWQLAAVAGFTTLFLLGDVWNVISIRRKLKEDPAYLKKKVSGT